MSTNDNQDDEVRTLIQQEHLSFLEQMALVRQEQEQLLAEYTNQLEAIANTQGSDAQSKHD